MASRGRAAVLLVALLLVGGCGGGGEGSDDSAKRLGPFAYDEDKPFEVETKATDRGYDGVDVRDVSFVGPDGNRLEGYLAAARESGSQPAVIYAHGAGGDRDEMIDEAIAMARRGAVTLTLTMRYSPTRPTLVPEGLEGIRVNAKVDVDAVREVLRTVDMLRSLPEVDDDRIGYVGWSQGGRTGAIVSGIDHRIRAFDLVAIGAQPMAPLIQQAPPEWQPELKKLFAQIDPLFYIRHAAPSQLLFQNGKDDDVFSKTELETLADRGSEPKEVRWYESGHLPVPKMWADSRAWLAERLDL
jgi:predicted esterase